MNSDQHLNNSSSKQASGDLHQTEASGGFFAKLNCSFLGAVFVPSMLFIILITLLCIIYPLKMKQILQFLQTEMFDNFSWFYILAVSFFVSFIILLALSKYGDIKLGRQNEDPQLPFLSWLAMLFAAGMGVGLMYFGVAEPLIHKNTLHTDEASAILHTVFHWGIHPWAIYAITALGMAYFGFRYNMPLSLRNAFYPLLKERTSGVCGHIVDILALCISIFGISTTLAYAAKQLNAGFIQLGILNSVTFSEQIVIIIVVIALATMSAISGANKGLRRLSEINLLLALALLIFVLVCSHPVTLLDKFSTNIGNYLHELIAFSFNTFSYEPEHSSWFHNWTIYYWAWWLSWAPFVGFFIAKISRGRTIREFVFGVLIAPSIFNILWFSVFSGAAFDIDAAHNGILSALISSPEALLYEFLKYLPAAKVATGIAILVLCVFFITSADSGIFVLNCLASYNKEDKTKWQSIMWGITIILLSGSLLYSGGVDAILSITMLVALPFAFMLVLMSLSLLKGLRADQHYFSKKMLLSSIYWSGEHWNKRLNAMVEEFSQNDANTFLNSVISPAMNKLCDRLNQAGFKASIINQIKETGQIKLIIKKSKAKDFIYGVKTVQEKTAKSLLADDLLPFNQSECYKPKTFFEDGRLGYDVSYLNENEIIVDILKHYERYLSLLSEESTEILTHDLG